MELPARAPPIAAPGSDLHAVEASFSEPDQAWSSFDQTPPDADAWE